MKRKKNRSGKQSIDHPGINQLFIRNIDIEISLEKF